MYKIILGLIVLTLASCNQKAKEISKEEKASYLMKGDSISTHAQKILLANVSQSITNSGVTGAIDFCNLNAMPLTDSVSSIYTASIQRLSDKNRNPNNAIQEESDWKAWEEIKLLMANKDIQEKHIIQQNGDNIYYYKPIVLGMPTCLSCHGQIDIDISSETYNNILSKYPKDKAIGYHLGELRGMWKIKI
ncbi:MAG: DUF3365 domain-containing protein [Chitinophagales bacterium]|nr:DUF3365 domain-containing protein [Chitinophagales bacterium]